MVYGLVGWCWFLRSWCLIFDLVLLAFCQFSLISFAVISFGCGFGVNCVCWLACLVVGWGLGLCIVRCC